MVSVVSSRTNLCTSYIVTNTRPSVSPAFPTMTADIS